MLALLDGDIFVFRAGFSCEKVDKQTKEKTVLPLGIAIARIDSMISDALNEVGATKQMIFLTDHQGNFRKQLSDDYKANRKDVAKPVHMEALEEYLIKQWGAKIAVGEETDDQLGIQQVASNERQTHYPTSVIVSIDKDLKQIPGLHYNMVKAEWDEVKPLDAQFFFYKQLMMGDPTDNIAGIPKIGIKKAQALLEPHYGNEEAIMNVVWEQYTLAYPKLSVDELEDLITTIGRMVYIRKHEGELWTIPDFM